MWLCRSVYEVWPPAITILLQTHNKHPCAITSHLLASSLTILYHAPPPLLLPPSNAVPTLTLSIQPPEAIALDVAPYNSLTLACVGTAPDGIAVTKAFEWRENSGDGQKLLVHNGESIEISNSQLQMPLSFSELTVTGNSIGAYTYICIGSMQVYGGLNVAASATATATIQGIYLYPLRFILHCT